MLTEEQRARNAEKSRRYRERNREKVKAAERKRRSTSEYKAKAAAQQRSRRSTEAGREASRASDKKWRSNPENLKKQAARMMAFRSTPDGSSRTKEQAAKWRASHPGRGTEQSRKSRTGWTPEMWEAAWVAQKGCCKICGVALRKNGRGRGAAASDHCHSTGKPRWLLCTGCNTGLGSFRDNPNLLRVAADLLDRWTSDH